MTTFLVVLTALFIDVTSGRSFTSGFVTALALVMVWQEMLDAWDQ